MSNRCGRLWSLFVFCIATATFFAIVSGTVLLAYHVAIWAGSPDWGGWLAGASCASADAGVIYLSNRALCGLL